MAMWPRRCWPTGNEDLLEDQRAVCVGVDLESDRRSRDRAVPRVAHGGPVPQELGKRTAGDYAGAARDGFGGGRPRPAAWVPEARQSCFADALPVHGTRKPRREVHRTEDDDGNRCNAAMPTRAPEPVTAGGGSPVTGSQRRSRSRRTEPVQKKQEQERQQPATMNEQTPFFE